MTNATQTNAAKTTITTQTITTQTVTTQTTQTTTQNIPTPPGPTPPFVLQSTIVEGRPYLRLLATQYPDDADASAIDCYVNYCLHHLHEKYGIYDEWRIREIRAAAKQPDISNDRLIILDLDLPLPEDLSAQSSVAVTVAVDYRRSQLPLSMIYGVFEVTDTPSDARPGSLKQRSLDPAQPDQYLTPLKSFYVSVRPDYRLQVSEVADGDHSPQDYIVPEQRLTADIPEIICSSQRFRTTKR